MKPHEIFDLTNKLWVEAAVDSKATADELIEVGASFIARAKLLKNIDDPLLRNALKDLLKNTEPPP